MCDPTVLAGTSFIMQAGQSLLSAKAQNAESAAVKKNALDNLKLQYRDLNQQQVDQNVAAAVAIVDAQDKTAGAVGATQAAASEGGVSGSSVDQLKNVLEGQQGAYDTSIYRNRDSAVAAIQRQKAGAAAEASQTIAAHPPANPLSTVLGIAGAAASAGQGAISRGGGAPKLGTSPAPGAVPFAPNLPGFAPGANVTSSTRRGFRLGPVHIGG